MPRLIWFPAALGDVQRAYRFLVTKNREAAQKAVGAIRSGVQILRHHPELGRPMEDMDREYREWLVDFGGSGYVILYRYDGEMVFIVAVRHQKEVGYTRVEKTLNP
ncbi:type II toxin-antitoxin system RelE/ParE family toxin [Acidithiobacillus sulfuriphilus]|uniref:Type II toxin-antitoxin system RelE/ParE family toxin n=2 Tax=Acidithiobacillus sulfuriphilus TaxID=1867749 RepID=A0A3M8S782_9PROT|nr:type II toxin-antitoxin system RelE/ParE family toxin [Acidithiobacillus sulfuriphilus]RNF76761.1 type II toxin-antitoxin system RelE/ParE family toxin [Acidithiobacillus sulfuriphilus]